MKRIIIILNIIIATATTACSQQEIANKTWTDGDVEYEVHKKNNTLLFYGANVSIVKYGFALNKQENGEMVISEMQNEAIEYYCVEEYIGCTVKYKVLNGQELLILRNSKGILVDILTVGKADEMRTSALVRCLAGTYADKNGKTYTFSADSPRASGFGGSERYTVERECYTPNFSISFEDNKSYLVVGEWNTDDETGVKLRFEPYNKNDEIECYPEETKQSIKTKKTKWDSNVANKTIPGRYPYTSTRVMTRSELMVFIIDKLDNMRNEIFARHGQIFKTARYNDYFNAQPWYKGTVDDATGLLSEIERLNVEQIKAVEAIFKNSN